MFTELEAPVDRSPNPLFTELLAEQNAEHQARLAFGQLEVGASLHPDVAPALVADIVHDPGARLVHADVGRDLADRFPFRVSASFRTFVSATPTGSINLRLRKQVEE